MCDLKDNLNINMSRLCKFVTLLKSIFKQSNQSITVSYSMIISEQIINILQQNIDEGSI